MCADGVETTLGLFVVMKTTHHRGRNVPRIDSLSPSLINGSGRCCRRLTCVSIYHSKFNGKSNSNRANHVALYSYVERRHIMENRARKSYCVHASNNDQRKSIFLTLKANIQMYNIKFNKVLGARSIFSFESLRAYHGYRSTRLHHDNFLIHTKKLIHSQTL